MTEPEDRRPQVPGGTPQRLDSWKSIAQYLGREVRTIQRWEKNEGLPIERLVHGSRGSVHAYTDKLDAWWRERQARGGTERDQRGHLIRRAAWAGAAMLVLLAAALGVMAVRSPRAPEVTVPGPPGPPGMARVFTGVAGAPAAEVALPAHPVDIVFTPDGREAWISSHTGRAITVIDVLSRAIAWRHETRGPAGALAVTPDGSDVVAVDREAGVLRIGVADRRVSTIAPGAGVNDIAISSDGRYVFAARVYTGLERIDLARGTLAKVPVVGCPVNVAVSGRTVFVSHQCEGPGGSRGRDSIEAIDVETLEPVRRFQGPPLVGGPLAASPDGAFLWVNGMDACFGDDYDRSDCPEVPGRVVHVFRVADGTLVKTLGFPVSSAIGRLRFLPGVDGIAIAGDPPVVIRNRTFARTESPDLGSVPALAAVPGRSEAWVLSTARNAVYVFPSISAPESLVPEGLVNHWRGDGTADDAVDGKHGRWIGGASFAAGTIGRAFTFDGGPRRVVFGAHENIDSANPSAGMTVALWARTEPRPSASVLLERVSTTETAPAGWRVAQTADGRLAVCFGDAIGPPCVPGTPNAVVSPEPLASGRWTHVAFTRDSMNVRLFVDGRAVAAGTLATLGGCEWCTLRAGGGAIGLPFRGGLDEIMLYDRALDPGALSRLVGPAFGSSAAANR
jgi:DNA-binding beta-propeller fold protein YncE